MSYEGPPGLISLRAVFLLQTLFAPATWAVPCIVPYGPPVVNNSVHERNCRVPTEIVRYLPTSLKAPVDPQHLVISSSDGFATISGPVWPRLGGVIPNILWLGGLRTQWWGWIRLHNQRYRKPPRTGATPRHGKVTRGSRAYTRLVGGWTPEELGRFKWMPQ